MSLSGEVQPELVLGVRQARDQQFIFGGLCRSLLETRRANSTNDALNDEALTISCDFKPKSWDVARVTAQLHDAAFEIKAANNNSTKGRAVTKHSFAMYDEILFVRRPIIRRTVIGRWVIKWWTIFLVVRRFAAGFAAGFGFHSFFFLVSF